MPIYALGDMIPEIDDTAFIHPDATVIGDVRLGPHSSVWPQAVLRGDNGYILIGARSNVQDGAVIHTTPMHPTTVGKGVVIGHLAHLEGCTVEDNVLIGVGASVLHEAVIGTGATVGAGAVVPNRTHVPPAALAVGVPVTIKADRSRVDGIPQMVASYVNYAERFMKELRRLD